MTKLDHLTLPVRDYQATKKWYIENLGLTVEFEIPDRRFAALQDSAGFTLFFEQSGSPGSAGCALYFQVDNVDRTYAELTRLGIPFTFAPGTQFWGYGAELADPDGHRVRLWDANSMKAKEASAAE